MNEAKRILGDRIELCKEIYDVTIDIDALVLVTEWSEFRIPNYKILTRLMKNRVIFDGRNIYDPAEMKENNFTYYSIGR